MMELYRATPRDGVHPRQLETTVRSGPFWVAAEHETWARTLVTMNFGIAIDRLPNEPVRWTIWSDSSASEFKMVEHKRPATVQPRKYMFRGVDSASRYIEKAELFCDGKLVAKMIWWPCGESDRCPANPEELGKA
jgi:hypothetical protein